MKLPHRRQFLYLAAGAAALPAVSRIARADAYPARPVRLLVGFAAGGTSDIVARLIGQSLSERLGQPFLIENRPGASTNIAVEAAVRANADGYTLVTVGATNTINASFFGTLNFNFIRDIAPVAGLIHSPLVLEVHPSVPVNTLREFITYAKANPGKISYGSFGTGSISHVAGELFKVATGVDLVHVPYRGSGPLLTDLLGGQVQAAFDNLPVSIEYIKAGKLKPLAITAKMRAAVLPDIPTVSETVPNYEAESFFGLGAPKNTPSDIIKKLNSEINASLVDRKIKARLAELGGEALVLSPEAFGKFLAEETEKWAKVIKFAGIRAE